MAVSRRSFLKKSLGAAGLIASISRSSFCAPLARTAPTVEAPPNPARTILVVLQLSGGNDGLNTVVPYADPLYAKHRPTLRLPPQSVHKIDSEFGLHPKMSALVRLYREGLVTIVHGVGYANPNQDHVGAMRVWQTADTEPSRSQTGWVGRTLDQLAAKEPEGILGVYVGPYRQPFALHADRTIVPSVRSLQDLTLHQMPGSQSVGSPGQAPRAGKAAQADSADPLLLWVQRKQKAAAAISRKVEAVAASRQAGSTYPRIQLASMLQTVAQLIRADVGIRIFYTELGGDDLGPFDTHAGQALNHGALLEQLSESVAAFADDLAQDKLLDRVVLMTFSEFGRTIQENGRRGTDHGSAQPIFLVGGRVKGGLVGKHPPLDQPEGGGQRALIDFRRIYATVLDRWLGIDSLPILGARFEPLDLLPS